MLWYTVVYCGILWYAVVCCGMLLECRQGATCVVLSGLVAIFFLHWILGGGKPPAEQFNMMLYPAVVRTQRGGTMVK